MILNELKNKKILILGFGREGQDTFKFLRKLFPNKVLGVADRLKIKDLRFKRVKLHLGKNYLKAIKDYDIIIKSPGIPFKILSKSTLKKITTQTEIFFDNCPGEIIGVAGTKGKSTTASLIYKILKTDGVKAHLIGNIGKPVLSFLLGAKKVDELRSSSPSLRSAVDEALASSSRCASPCSTCVNNIFIYELSSFQLMNLKKSPQVAVLLNNYPDHLDYHKDFQEYVEANANITLHQTKNDYLVYNSVDKLVRQIAKKSKAKKIPIKGKYYSLNKEAAKAVARIFKIPDEKITQAIKEFKPLSHRLELVGNYQGITFYNDSLSVIPETTIAALDFLGDKVQTLILGGFERGLNFKNLAKKILKSKVKTLILFPTTGERIWQEISKIKIKNKPQRFFADNMIEVIKLSYLNTNKGKICLLSPASASFGIFKDYRQRGNLFKNQVFAQRKHR